MHTCNAIACLESVLAPPIWSDRIWLRGTQSVHRHSHACGAAPLPQRSFPSARFRILRRPVGAPARHARAVCESTRRGTRGSPWRGWWPSYLLDTFDVASVAFVPQPGSQYIPHKAPFIVTFFAFHTSQRHLRLRLSTPRTSVAVQHRRLNSLYCYKGILLA